MKRLSMLIAFLAILTLNAQEEMKWGVTANFHKGSIVGVHDYSKGRYGGGLGIFGEVALVENDV
ncbi:hypothetical protein [uncultured Chryseobacterium sp.]|uniref:hypothetical protein n=1 Tax=uncultured Chryseobacterium sp. TaxID=259322 RepID=UPI00261DBEB3|nr:hypothetical protein [uncultured Chryseobacterium sp.]